MGREDKSMKAKLMVEVHVAHSIVRNQGPVLLMSFTDIPKSNTDM